MSANGIKTSFWGPHAWNFLFCTIAGSYPVRYDASNKDHQRRVRGFVQMFNSLKETLPCIYCRNSYKQFLRELPIKDYITTRISMLTWLYLMHDKVNKKLIAQEQLCYNSELKKLKDRLSSKEITSTKYKQQALALKSIKITKPSPSLQSVINKFELQRAGCNPTTKKCA